jgi:hypothetical protein
MIRCVRIWTGKDDNSHFEEGLLNIKPGRNGDLLTGEMPVSTVAFEETHAGGKLEWRTAPSPPADHHPERYARFLDTRRRAFPAATG